MNWFLIKNILSSKRTYTKNSKYATEILNFIRKNGKYKDVWGTGIVFAVDETTYIVDCGNFPVEDLKTIYIVCNGEIVKLIENTNPSKLARIRFWHFIDKHIRAKAYIKLVNCALANNPEYGIDKND